MVRHGTRHKPKSFAPRPELEDGACSSALGSDGELFYGQINLNFHLHITSLVVSLGYTYCPANLHLPHCTSPVAVKEITILNVYAPNVGVPTYIKQTLIVKDNKDITAKQLEILISYFVQGGQIIVIKSQQ